MLAKTIHLQLTLALNFILMLEKEGGVQHKMQKRMHCTQYLHIKSPRGGAGVDMTSSCISESFVGSY